MIEPTESESLSELDRFCDTLISIKSEIDMIKTGKFDKIDNPIKNAPHTDIELAENTEDEEYLNILFRNLKILNQNKYDFIFYVAGVDIHCEDRLGKLKITDAGVNKRDQIVIDNFNRKNIPLCGVLGGGYNKSFEKLIELHSMLHKNCAEIIR